MFRKCSGIAVLTSMVSSHPEICKTGMHPEHVCDLLRLSDNVYFFGNFGLLDALTGYRQGIPMEN
jgi:hypothetical protein